MKKVSKANLNIMKAAMKYVDSVGEDEYDCDYCPMSKQNNGTGKLCYELIFASASHGIFDEAGSKDQHDIIRYILRKSKQVRSTKI